MKRFFCIVLCIFLLIPWVSAAETEEETPNLTETLKAFIVQNKLNEENFAMSFFNTTTGETFTYNDRELFPIGEVWTLPLNMHYALQESKGAFEPKEGTDEYYDRDYEYTINGMNLESCRFESISKGNLSVSKAMRDAVKDYKDVINSEFGHLSETETTERYYEEDCYSAKFLMNCMLELERTPEIYGEMIREYDSVAQPSGFFTGEDSAASKYRTVQIRGEEGDFVCVVAEVSTACPYLIVAIISKQAGGDTLLASLNNTIANHIESEKTPVVEPTVETAPKDASVFKVNSSVADRSPVFSIILIALGGIAALGALLYVVLRVIRRNRDY